MEELLSSHNQTTIDRCSKQTRVFLTMDTMEVDLTKSNPPVQGTGPLRTGKRKGFFFHPMYAVNENGLPLGVVDQVIWTRNPASGNKSASGRKNEPTNASSEEKESSRWLKMMQRGKQIARSLPHVQFVASADIESDISELLSEASERPENYNFIIRQNHPQPITAAVDSSTGKSITAATVDEALSLAEWRTERDVHVDGQDALERQAHGKRSQKQPQIAHDGKISTKAITVTIAVPRRSSGGALEDLTINVVEVREQNLSTEKAPSRWLLFTSLPITTVEQLNDTIDGYRLQSKVGLYFTTLTNGLKIEELNCETLEQYLTEFSVFAEVAWRVEYLTGAAYSDPESSCETYFLPEEWIAVMGFLGRPIDRENPPGVRTFMLSVAQLGGYINKKSQGDPGSKTLWGGMAKFDTIVGAFAIFNQLRAQG
ncbi:MAG: IS4 family transposase [Planctomyces sp.]|nr:IS4 family transposase [Planctomyces sp.]